MKRFTLHPHPDGRWPRGTAVEATANRAPDGSLTLHYRVSGNLSELRFPPRAPSRRADGLWRHTCFEAFLRRRGGEGYVELNVAPSTEWTAYAFSARREGMSPALDCPAPAIRFELGEAAAGMHVELELGGMEILRGEPWLLGLAVILEDVEARLSYWALAHPTGTPDFHHPDGFLAELP